MERLVETAAEIEKLLISDIDELFEKRIFLYYGKTTSDGVKLGPSWWSTKLAEQGIAMSANAVRKRHDRWVKQSRRSEPDSEGSPAPTPSNEGNIRGARSAIKKFPNLAKKLVEDPEVRTAIAQAIDEREMIENRMVSKPDGKELIESYDEALLSAKAAKALSVLRYLRMNYSREFWSANASLLAEIRHEIDLIEIAGVDSPADLYRGE